jgi:hypothetical protein
MNQLVTVVGLLMGHRRGATSGEVRADVVHVPAAAGSSGPASNAFVLVEHTASGFRSRYISWINYFDLEYAARREPGGWSLVEPTTPYRREVSWQPYGWSGMTPVPTIGDALICG